MTSNYLKDLNALPVYKKFTTGKEGLFVQIPKTAGTSIHRSLKMLRAGKAGPNFKKHYTIHELIELVPPDVIKRAFVFSIVRNPWDKLVSAYFFLRRVYLERGVNRTPAPDQAFSSFHHWVNVQREINGWNDHNIRPQSEWIYDSNDHLLVDFVGRFENLEHDFRQICTHLNLPITPLEFHNRSMKRPVDYRVMYTKEHRELVAEVYKRDIEFFGYSF